MITLTQGVYYSLLVVFVQIDWPKKRNGKKLTISCYL